MHVPFDYRVAPLLIAKYNSIMKFGKLIKYFHVKRQKKEHKVYFYFAFLGHLAHPFLQHGFLLSGEELGSRASDAMVSIRTMLAISHGQKGKELSATEVRVPDTLCF